MIEGIHVLNKIIETEAPVWSLWLFLGIFFFITLIGVIVCMFVFDEGEDRVLGSLGCAFIGLIIGMIVSLPIDLIVKVPTGEYTYQVTIDKNVSMTEFNDKYDIIKQEGEIYYIREKDGE